MSEMSADRMKVLGLIGAGFAFSQREDYDTALEWAERAYNLGRNEAGLAGPCMAHGTSLIKGQPHGSCTLRAGHIGGHEDDVIGMRWISRGESA